MAVVALLMLRQVRILGMIFRRLFVVRAPLSLLELWIFLAFFRETLVLCVVLRRVRVMMLRAKSRHGQQQSRQQQEEPSHPHRYCHNSPRRAMQF